MSRKSHLKRTAKKRHKKGHGGGTPHYQNAGYADRDWERVHENAVLVSMVYGTNEIDAALVPNGEKWEYLYVDDATKKAWFDNTISGPYDDPLEAAVQAYIDWFYTVPPGFDENFEPPRDIRPNGEAGKQFLDTIGARLRALYEACTIFNDTDFVDLFYNLFANEAERQAIDRWRNTEKNS